MFEQKDSSIFDLAFDSESSGYLNETAKWAKLLSIVGLIVSILIILIGIFFAAGGSSLGSSALAGFSMAIVGMVYVIIGILYLYPSWQLLQFANNVKAGIAKSDQVQLNLGLKGLKSCFRFMGIFTLIILGVYALILVGGIFMAAFQ